VSRWGSSIFPAFQLAAYMGFGHIFLIGCDLGYYANTNDGIDRAHFDEDYLGAEHHARRNTPGIGKRLMRDEIRVFTCHEISIIKLRDMGIQIHLCNKGPLLELYEYMSIEDAIAYKPLYYTPIKRDE